MHQNNWLSKGITRRGMIRGLGGMGLLGITGLAGCAHHIAGENKPDLQGLGALAGAQDKLYGAAVQSYQLGDPTFASALKKEINLMVPETELKWDIIRPSRDTFNFTPYRKLADFARANAVDMRGHTMLWHRANPPWLEQTLAHARASEAEKLLRDHIERLVAETAGEISNWDVVNEAVDPHSPRPDGLRETPWLRALGPEYISLAFNIAHAADPGLVLVYNDFGLEYDDGPARAKRHALFHLLMKFRKAEVPIHALGLQSHLQCHRPLGGIELAAFLRAVRGFDIKIMVTELDVDTSHLNGSLADRNMIAQSYVSAYLEVIERTGEIDTLLTWGLSDRYSWLKEFNGSSAGALPLNANMQRGPLWDTLKTAWLDA